MRSSKEGVELVEVPVGDRHVSDELERRGLSFGGEQSGHVIFTDVATTGDGTLTGVVLLDVVHAHRPPLVAPRGRHGTLPAGAAQRAGRATAAASTATASSGRSPATCRANWATTGRVLVRPSGTEPVVRVMVEAATTQQAEAVAERLVTAVTDACGAVAEPDTPDR